MNGYGAMYNPGQEKSCPGAYMTYFNNGENRLKSNNGELFTLIQAEVGPLNEVVTIHSVEDVEGVYGAGKGSDTVKAALEGGAVKVHTLRVGKGGKPAVFDDLETGVKIESAYPTGQDMVLEEEEKLAGGYTLAVYSNGALLEEIDYTDARDIKSTHLNISIDDTYVSDKVLKGEKSTGTGEAPTVEDANYIGSLEKAEVFNWDALLVDNESKTVHFAAHTFVRRMLKEGRRVYTVLGLAPEMTTEEKMAYPKAFNDFLVICVGNGFIRQDRVYEGATSAAYLAGMIVKEPYTYNASFKTIRGAVEVVGQLKPYEYDEAADKGLVVYAYNRNGDVKVDYGINTITTFDDKEDEGWRELTPRNGTV